ncbi:MAG: FKBP-type peptidyl-prolyl cis-trans isomerase [Trueperella sp.]|nr:FKBP-type peptidyl-prolyl cis-trans isomerase [Trueperella sp.]
MRKVAIALAAVLMLVGVVGCSSSDDKKETDATATEVQIASADIMPSLNEDGEFPVLEFPSSKPPAGLQLLVLEKGKGRTVESTDLIVANYVGQVWGNADPFDSSFERKMSTSFELFKVIPGWQKGLAGLQEGAKVILSIPPEMGYGDQGAPSAGIGGADTIAFYVEVVAAYGNDQAGDPDAAMQVELDSLPVAVTGELGKPVTIKVKDSAEPPAELTTTVIARGSGAPVGGEDSRVYISYAMTLWDNSQKEETYAGNGPQEVPIVEGSPFVALSGIPVGSRVLITAPANGGDGSDSKNPVTTPAYAIMVDILGIQLPPEK